MELAIDTVGPTASIALSDKGRIVAEFTWPAGRRHTPTLVPMIDQACRLAQVESQALTAVFVDVGPGAYGGIRSGIATATALALALTIPALGVGRLEIETYAHAASPGDIAAVHAAGRGQWALARYRGPASTWTELSAPCLHPDWSALFNALHCATASPGLLTGDLDRLSDPDRSTLVAQGWTLATPAAALRRAGFLAELGWNRLQAGGDLSLSCLEPIYLREPAIGPQPQPPAQTESQNREPLATTDLQHSSSTLSRK